MYIGNDQITGVYVGTNKIEKLYQGTNIVYEETSTPPVYTEDNGTTLVISPTAQITTEVYDMDSGETTTEITTLSEPLKLNNLTQSSYGDNYYYSPELETTTSTTDYSGGGTTPSSNEWYVVHNMIYRKSSSYNLNSSSVMPTNANSKITTESPTTVTFGNDLAGKNIRIRFNFTIVTDTSPHTDGEASGANVTYTVTDTSNNVLTTYTVENYKIKNTNYLADNYGILNFTVPSNKQVKISLTVDRTNDTNGGGGVGYLPHYTRVGYISCITYIVENYYNQNVLLGIRRNMFKQSGVVLGDSIEMTIKPTLSSMYQQLATVSMTDQGVLTIVE